MDEIYLKIMKFLWTFYSDTHGECILDVINTWSIQILYYLFNKVLFMGLIYRTNFTKNE